MSQQNENNYFLKKWKYFAELNIRLEVLMLKIKRICYKSLFVKMSTTCALHKIVFYINMQLHGFKQPFIFLEYAPTHTCALIKYLCANEIKIVKVSYEKNF